MAPLLVLSASPLLVVGPMVSVEAPWRMLISGQSICSAVPVTDCCEVAVEPEKKPSILSRVELDDAAVGGQAAARTSGQRQRQQRGDRPARARTHQITVPQHTPNSPPQSPSLIAK
jgi:hypothetical protein